MIDTSLFVADGSDLRAFSLSAIVAAKPAQVFASFTQPTELVKFFGSKHNVELKVGGSYEIHVVTKTERSGATAARS